LIKNEKKRDIEEVSQDGVEEPQNSGDDYEEGRSGSDGEGEEEGEDELEEDDDDEAGGPQSVEESGSRRFWTPEIVEAFERGEFPSLVSLFLSAHVPPPQLSRSYHVSALVRFRSERCTPDGME
jgi:hypothetical protein